MASRRLGVIMHGVTGRMGTNQHLVRSILAIRDDGGVRARQRRPRDARSDPGRPQRRQGRGAGRARTASSAGRPTSTAALADSRRRSLLRRRHDADAPRPARARHRRRQARLLREADRDRPRRGGARSPNWPRRRGVKNGVVMDKLFLPGLMKLAMLRKAGFFGRMLAVRGEFGYWVFEGDLQPIQRPSWNYRAEDGGGIILDMLCHWRYVLDHTVRRGGKRLVPATRRTSRSAGTRPASPTRRPPTTRPSRPSSSKAASSRPSIRRG